MGENKSNVEPEVDPSSGSEKKSLYLFGTNVAEIPCYRDSLLNGMGGGFAGGLLYFLFTSNSRAATNFAVGTFTVTSLGYWIHCRYNYTKLKFEFAQIAAGLKQKALYEGTPVEKEIENKLEEKGIDLKTL